MSGTVNNNNNNNNTLQGSERRKLWKDRQCCVVVVLGLYVASFFSGGSRQLLFPSLTVPGIEPTSDMARTSSSTSQIFDSTVQGDVATLAETNRIDTSIMTAPHFQNHSWWVFPNYTYALARLAVEPVSWQCDSRNKNFTDTVEPSKRRIFSFVHIFKCSGSTIRSFFYTYAEICHRGWTLLIRCSQADPNSISAGEEWMPCKRKVSVLRDDGKVVWGKTRELQRVKPQMIQQGADVFGGHFKIGIGNHLKNPVQYITFLREPMSKYVSSCIFTHKDKTKEWIMDKIKGDITKDRQLGRYYMRIEDYLLTPFQKPVMIHASALDRATLIVDNMLTYNVVVGLTEAMSDSMEIFQHIFDTKKEMTLLFEKYGLNREGSETLNKRNATSIVRNKSRLSSTEILAEFQQDEDFMNDFTEYVKYEKWIYDFGMKMHQVQLDVVRSQ